MSGAHPTEDRLYEFMHEHGQRMEDIEAHLGVLHNSFMEVNDRLNDLDTGRCRCRVNEEEVPLPLRVRGQRARRSRPFWANLPSDRDRLAQGRSHGGAEGQWQHRRRVGDARTT